MSGPHTSPTPALPASAFPPPETSPGPRPARGGFTVQHVFSLAVLAFALVAAASGAAMGDRGMLGIAFSGLLLAAACWLSVNISSFLRIFSGIFAVEYVVFGALTLLIRAGLWPE